MQLLPSCCWVATKKQIVLLLTGYFVNVRLFWRDSGGVSFLDHLSACTRERRHKSGLGSFTQSPVQESYQGTIQVNRGRALYTSPGTLALPCGRAWLASRPGKWPSATKIRDGGTLSGLYATPALPWPCPVLFEVSQLPLFSTTQPKPSPAQLTPTWFASDRSFFLHQPSIIQPQRQTPPLSHCIPFV